MPLPGRLRRQATSARRRAPPPAPRAAARPAPAPEAASHDVEIFSEDFKLLRTLLILLFLALVIYVGKVVDRWSAATAIHQHLENVFLQAVHTPLQARPVVFTVEFHRVPSAEYFADASYEVQAEPDARPLLLVEAAGQVLQALQARGLPVHRTFVTLPAPDDKGTLSVEVTVGPLDRFLVSTIDRQDPARDFNAADDKRTPEQVAEEQPEIEGFQLVLERCPRKPSGATMRPVAPTEIEAEGRTTRRAPGPTVLRMDAPQVEIRLAAMTLDGVPSGDRYGGPKFDLLLFRQPDSGALNPPLRCGRAYLPRLARTSTSTGPAMEVFEDFVSPKKPLRLHPERSDKDIQRAREELESPGIRLFDMLQLSFDNLLYLFPAVLLLLSAICASVMRRMALSLPAGVQMGDVLLNQGRSHRALTVHDGTLVRGIEKVVRITLLTLSIFCPLVVILTLPVLADASFSYEQASQPVVYLYNHARSGNGMLWLLPLAAALLLGLHQWCLILPPPDDGSGRAPLAHLPAVRWLLLPLVGLPATGAVLAACGFVAWVAVQGIWDSLLGTYQDELSLADILAFVGMGCMAVAMMAAVLCFWQWIARARWLETRRGNRWVIGCCALGALVLAYSGEDVFANARKQPDTLGILSAVGCALCLWVLVLQLKPRHTRSRAMLAVWFRRWRRSRALPPLPQGVRGLGVR